MNTQRFWPIHCMYSEYLSFLSAVAIFCMVVIISFLLPSLIVLTRLAVLVVLSTQPFSKLLYSSTVWSSRSLLSIRKNTRSTALLSRSSVANLNEVSVFPLPVVWKTYPLKLLSTTLLNALLTAYI